MTYILSRENMIPQWKCLKFISYSSRCGSPSSRLGMSVRLAGALWRNEGDSFSRPSLDDRSMWNEETSLHPTPLHRLSTSENAPSKLVKRSLMDTGWPWPQETNPWRSWVRNTGKDSLRGQWRHSCFSHHAQLNRTPPQGLWLAPHHNLHWTNEKQSPGKALAPPRSNCTGKERKAWKLSKVQHAWER